MEVVIRVRIVSTAVKQGHKHPYVDGRVLALLEKLFA